MRVISGKYGGRKLISPSGRDIRPTTDRAKENLFNVLQNDLEGAIVIDLFCGSASLGIEALSRGAKKCYFCDKNGQALKIASQNLSFVPDSDYELIKSDYLDSLQRLATRGVKADLIICDPPYDLLLADKILERIEQCQILNAGGTVIIEHDSYDEEVLSNTFDLVDSRKYGEVGLSFYKKLRKIAVTGTFDPFTKGHKDLVVKALEDFDRVYVLMLINPNKSPKYSVKDRLEMIRLSLYEFRKRIVIEYYEGLTVDYLKKNNVKYILRGLRSENDLEYEKTIADYNYEHGNIKTIFMPALHSEISSTVVKENIAESKAIKGLVEENIEDLLNKR
ncbi:MAG TPA: 16S rRNA (guanine(966)-N(2))-methyltransferase RsmD [Clostridia bacterium]|nr:16S rRNA (guanine(966)-N(2))-methyltransferase RsmD [Clostridia bacterium]